MKFLFVPFRNALNVVDRVWVYKIEDTWVELESRVYSGQLSVWSFPEDSDIGKLLRDGYEVFVSVTMDGQQAGESEE